MLADLLIPNRCHWQIAKVKNFNLNVTEVRDPDFKNASSCNFQFHRRAPTIRNFSTSLVSFIINTGSRMELGRADGRFS